MPEYIYDERGARAYDLAVPVDQDEIDFHLEFARDAQRAGLRTLELACGTGRIAVPLAREGVELVGLDRAEPMLAGAGDKSREMRNLEWLRGDMREFSLGERSGFIFITAGSFQLLVETEDQLRCLRCVREHLAPRGRFAFNVQGFNIAAMPSWTTDHRGVFVCRPQRDYVDPDSGHEMRTWASIEYHTAQRSISLGFTEEVDADGNVLEKHYAQPMELRYFGRYEVEHLLARCGMEVEALCGDFRKGAYRAASEMYWVARPVD